jgi:fructosamine-3-kinase
MELKLRSEIENRLGTRILDVQPLTGGDIHASYRIRTENSVLFVKTNAAAPAGMFALEADGLQRLGDVAGVRVPQTVAVAPGFLALEYLRPAPPTSEFGRGLARMTATLHAAPTSAQYGLETDNYLGMQPQDNTPCDDWTFFFRERRLLPQMERAERTGRLAGDRRRMLEEIVDTLPQLLAGVPRRPSLLHGDLWSGNFLCTELGPAFIDPAVYRGDREIEIAFTELFGGFPADFVAAYHAEYPLAPDYPRRRSLYQLHPLLVHLNHFGETYGPAVDNAARRVLAG